MSNKNQYDIVITGAGPAGATAAMALRNSGLKIAIIDKAKFPRDKVCGDAIGGRVKKVLREINPEVLSKFEKLSDKNISRGWKLFTPDEKNIEVMFVNSGYVCRRTDFDNFLVEQIRNQPNVTLIEEKIIKDVYANSDCVEVIFSPEEKLSAKLLIACDGAHSVAAKKLANFKVEYEHYSGAVRAYYKNISGIENKEMIEIHLVKNFLPGYFWIFPVSETLCNVGFGMLSKDIQKRKIDLKDALKKIIGSSPELSNRFQNAELVDEIRGFGLPLGGKQRNISGERFILCGDAASLIDPLTGEGIGNAMMSAKYAAEQALNCFAKNNFSTEEIKNYDKKVYKNLLPELKKNLLLQKVFNRPWLINLLAITAKKNPRLKNWAASKL